MKRRLLDLIVCPYCRGEFALDFFSIEKSGEVTEGRLRCEGCGRPFPIIAGVPRLLPDELRDLLQVHGSFFEKYGSHFPHDYVKRAAKETKSTAQIKKTSSSFGFEWTTFPRFYEQWEDNFQGYIRPLTPSFFKKKQGLDVGCGTGRHLYFAARYGAQMVGVDLSEAVQTAYANTLAFPHVHVVQADLRHLPFNMKYFDFIYSFGVLHHLPEPERGFNELLPFLKPKGHIMIYVYNSYREESKIKYLLLKIASFLRLMTTRLPLRPLYQLCYLLALIIYSFVVFPYKILRFFLKQRGRVDQLPFAAYLYYPFGVLHNDLFDRFSAPIENRYTKKEIKKWYERSGLKNIHVVENYGWVVHGEVTE